MRQSVQFNSVAKLTIRALPVVGLLFAAACSDDEGPYRKDTTKVTGRVLVDGNPAEMLRVMCHDVNGMDQEHPSLSSTLTAEDGTFEIATYEAGDGVPAGDYTLTFMWGQLNLMAGTYGGPDKLNGRYSDPEASEHEFTVSTGDDAEPIDLGTIELTTE